MSRQSVLIIKIFLFIVVFFNEKRIAAQIETSVWQTYHSPIYSNLSSIQANRDTLFVGSNKGILFKKPESKWQVLVTNNDISFDRIHIIHANQIYVAENTIYQESTLFFWNGMNWKEIETPIVNSISDMYFEDKNNGIITSYGELAQLKNAVWKHINPPTNKFVSNLVVTNLDNFYVLVAGEGVYHFTGSWKLMPDTKDTKLIKKIDDKIFLLENEALFELIDDKLILRSKNEMWNQVNNITITNKNLIVGVGDNGLILNFVDNNAILEQHSISVNLNDVICRKDTCYIVGDDGTILLNKNLPDTVKSGFEWKGFEKKYFKQFAKIVDDEYGVVVADFNSDGKPDIFTNGLFEKEHLYINTKQGEFLDQAEEFGVVVEKNKLNLGACATDVDNDGFIDLYISVLNGPNILYKNRGGTHFVNYSSISGGIGEPTDRTNMSAFADIDNDGDLDLFITNENSTNRLYRNNGAGIYTEITRSAGVLSDFGGNSASFADIDNDGDVDLFVTNWSTQNLLYKNMFKESGQIFFENITEKANVGGHAFSKSNACVFADVDNDADLDLFVSNRKTTNHLYFNDGKGNFIEHLEAFPKDNDKSYGAVIADFDSDGWKDIYVSNVGKNKLYKNLNGSFKPVSQKYNADIGGYSTGSALIDYDSDNDWDIYVSNYVGKSSVLLHNKGNTNTHTLSIILKGNINNSNSIGTKVYVYSNKSKDSVLYYNEVISGSGYVSMNETKHIIPVNDKNTYLKVVFPNGIIREFSNLPTDKTEFIIEDVSGFKKNSTLFRKYIKRQFLDPHNLFVLLKYILVVLLLGLFVYKTLPIIYFPKLYVWGLALLLLVFYATQNHYFEYDSIVLSTLLPLSSIIVLTMLLFTFFEKHFLREQAFIKQNQIKIKLSRDLHDDLSATISSIGFYLAVIKSKIEVKQQKLSKMLLKSETLVQNASDSLTDLIWAINPKPERLSNLLLRLQNNYQTIFIDKGIHFKILRNSTKDVFLYDTNKQHVYLIVKEAITNSLKYAEATEISIIISRNRNKTQLLIQDNGKGFDLDAVKHKGHGLTNIKERVSELEGILNIDSSVGIGTTITVIF